MTIGDKIKSARLEREMTQAEVAEDKITRNMLSAIESNKSFPSLETLFHISSKLDVPVAYLLSDDFDICVYTKNRLIDQIRAAFSEKRFSDCISLISKIQKLDDELTYILAYSYYELGVLSAKRGSFVTAEKYLTLAKEFSLKTVYDTRSIECKIPLYESFVKNVNSPLLDFNIDGFSSSMVDLVDYEFFRYICNDADYSYTNQLYKKHVLAKTKIKERKYYEAIELLLEISESKASYEYNAYLMYGVYGDLDNCYKQVFDFENAYKYSGKRISMLEGFNS